MIMSDYDDSSLSSDREGSLSPSNGPTSPGEAFRDLRLRKSCGEILLSRYQKVRLYFRSGLDRLGCSFFLFVL